AAGDTRPMLPAARPPALRSSAVMEQQLPLGALHLQSGALQIRTGLAAGPLAKVDKAKRIPGILHRNPVPPADFGRSRAQRGKNCMSSGSPEPIARVSRIGLLAVDDAVPGAAFRSR